MIMKIQVPLFSNERNPPALIYAEGRKHMRTLSADQLPMHVLAAALETGKAYFYVQLMGGRVRFHKRAPAQDW